MWRRTWRLRPRGVAFLAAPRAIAIAMAVIGGGVACSWLIPGDLPAAIQCRTDVHPDPCMPLGEVCSGNAGGTSEGTCTPKCSRENPCGHGLVCDPSGWCYPPETGGPDVNVMVAPVTSDDDGGPPTDAPAGGDDVASEGPADTAVTLGDGQAQCQGFGCKCAVNSDCAAGFACVDRSTVIPAWDAGGAGAGTGRVCMAPCCRSSDCDITLQDGGMLGAQVCFASGVGGNYCVPAGILGDRSTIGQGIGGSPCGDDAGACRSGLCVAGTCADTCCSTKSSTECANGYCHFGPFPGAGFDMHEAANCSNPPSAGATTGGNDCQMNSDCRSDLCTMNPGGGGPGPSFSCRDACRNRDDCSLGGMMMRSQTCTYVPLGGEIVAACMPLQNFGPGDGGAAAGQPCQTSSDCTKGYCALQPSGQRVCLSPCFQDPTSNNSSPDCLLNAERCRPQPIVINSATYSVLACGPP